MEVRRALGAAVLLAALAGCSEGSRPAAPPTPRQVSIAFTAEVDVQRGTLSIVAQEPLPAGASGLLVEVPVVRDGVPGTGPADTVELVTESVATVPDGCGVGLTSFEGDVRLRSFYAGASLENAHVEILSMSITGRESCNSSTPVPEGTSDQYGLWSYGTLQPAPGPGNDALARWKLKLPDATSFTFAGRVVADVVQAPTPVAQVSGQGSATAVAPGVAWDAAGNGLAVWREMTAAGYRVLYAYYSVASSAWSEPAVLVTEPSTTNVTAYASAKVVSNGTTFLAVWSTLTEVQGAIFTSGVPGAVKPLFGGNSLQDGFDVAANGGRYAVVNSGTSGNVVALIHDGSAWSAPLSIESTLGTADRPVLAPYGTTGFVAAFRLDGTKIYQSRHYGTSWSAATLVPGATGTATLVGPAVAGSGTWVVVAWAPSTGTAMANVDTGTGFPPTATEIGALAGPPTALSAAANGNYFAVVWPRSGFDAYGAIFNQTYWSGPYQLASGGKAYAARVAPSNAGFTAAFTLGDDGYVRPSLWLNKTAFGSSYRWDSASALLMEAAGGDVRDPAITRLGTGVAVAWAQDGGDSHDVNVRTHDGTSLGTQAAVSLPARAGSARQVSVARSGAGQVMAVWTQDHRGGPAVFAALRTGESWEGPVLLDLNASSPAIASDGAGFMVVYGRIDASRTSATPTANVVARRWTGSAFDAPVVIGAGSAPAIASDGTGYAAAFLRGTTAVYSSVYESGAWSTPVSRNPVAGYFGGVTIAARPGVYTLAFKKTNAPAGIYAARAKWATSWTWETTQSVYQTDVTAGPAIAAVPDAFSILWRSNGTVESTTRPDANQWWPPPYRHATTGDGPVALASNGSACLAAYGASGLFVHEWDCVGSAGTTTQVGLATTALAVATGAGAYEVLSRQTFGTAYDLVAVREVPGFGFETREIEYASEPVQPSLGLVHDGTEWVGLWTQQSADDSIADAVQSGWGF